MPTQLLPILNPCTGDIPGKKPSSVTVIAGETKLTVTFKLVDGALG